VMLRMVLSSNGLCHDVRGQKVVFTTPVNSVERTRLRTAVYPLPQPEPRLDEEYWAQIVAANIDGHVEGVPGAIIVVASAAGQRRARLVIDTICSLKAATREPVAIPPSGLSAAEGRVLAALGRPTSLEVVEMPLKDIVLHLVEKHGCPLILMADKLEEASVSLDTPITKSFKDISLQSLLRLMLKDLELTYVIREEAIVITTPEDAESHERMVAYPVQDLTQVGEGLFDAESLAELVEACIAPDKWGAHSGPPTILPLDDGWLIFEQTDPVHEQVAGFLAAMRQILSSADHMEVQPINARTEAERKIRAAMDQPIELSFQDAPLKDIVLHLQKVLNVPIVLSLKKLEEASISADTPITIKLPARRARDQLEQLLKTQELDFLIRDEVLHITTPEDAGSQLDTRVYDTRRLIGQRMSGDDLCQLIETKVQPRSWDDVGGPGCVDVYRDMLVVMHTERVHEEIDKLLATLEESASRSDERTPRPEGR